MVENTKTLEKEIKDILRKAPELRGYTLEELKEKITRPWPTGRWHLEYCESPRSSIERIGGAYKELEALSKKSKSI